MKCSAARRHWASLQRSRLFLRRRLSSQKSVEAVAVLQKDQNPEHGCYQCRRNACRRKRQMKREDVIKLRRKQRKRERHKEARKQKQAANQLHREEERGKMRRADGDKELYRQRIRRRWLMDEVEKSVQAKDCKHQPQQIARNDRNNFHRSSPLDRLRVRLHGLKV